MLARGLSHILLALIVGIHLQVMSMPMPMPPSNPTSKDSLTRTRTNVPSISPSVTASATMQLHQNTAQSSVMEPPYFVVYALDYNEAHVGPPPVDKLKGINVVIMAFLLGDGKPAEWSQAEQWQKMNPDQRAAVKKEYSDHGIKLLVSALGAEEAPTTNNIDAKKLAKKMAKWVKDNDVDGIDVDYEDMKAMAAGKSEQWIIDFTKQLYSELDRTHIITHAPIAGWFTPPRDELPGGGYRKVHKEVGHMVDWYNIQFYNSPGEDTTCHNMLEKSGSYLSESSVFEIHDKSQVPLEKIVIGKPASKKDAATGYMDAKQLGTCLEQASAKNWHTGFMLWQYSEKVSEWVQEARGSVFPMESN
ncbi:chitinase [Mycena rebaudengoi]|nr:chitinase [Mycena rebaudengoi]